MARLLLRLSLVALSLALALTVALQLRMPREVVEVLDLPDDVLGIALAPTMVQPTEIAPTAPPTTSTPAPLASSKPFVVTLQQGREGYAGCTDSFVQYYAQETNYCSSPELFVVTTDKATAFLRFDLAALPGSARGLDASATILKATLEVYAVQGNKGVDIGLYLPHIAWDACTITWTKPWQKPGANGLSDREFDPQVVVHAGTAPEWISFDVTGLVQHWLRDPTGNHGVILKSLKTAVPSHHILFSSENADPQGRPRLTIQYEAAEPVPLPSHTPVPTETPAPTLTTAPSITPEPPPTIVPEPTATSTAAPTTAPLPSVTTIPSVTPTYIAPGSPRVIEIHWWNQMEAGGTYPVRLIFRPEKQDISASSFDVYVLGVNAQLSASTFDIATESAPLQVLTDPELSLTWTWILQPRFTGEQSLSLDMHFGWTPAVMGEPAVRTEPGVWYQTRTTRVNDAFPYWPILRTARGALMGLGLVAWLGWLVLRKRKSQR